ncbi:Protein of unknown function [Pyronema omphalodes CBS 100304]|uniref:Uncharacterized protein n=1 Tax=Pyronema omphalodes (strain CBS 100304) TaxID=1076935 RepID=U4LID6_PYROM|nr:Protein of unknown function [Pyronema omphalodes CBS 100304]
MTSQVVPSRSFLMVPEITISML